MKTHGTRFHTYTTQTRYHFAERNHEVFFGCRLIFQTFDASQNSKTSLRSKCGSEYWTAWMASGMRDTIQSIFAYLCATLTQCAARYQMARCPASAEPGVLLAFYELAACFTSYHSVVLYVIRSKARVCKFSTVNLNLGFVFCYS